MENGKWKMENGGVGRVPVPGLRGTLSALTLALTLFFVPQSAKCQQDPQLSQYMFNTLLINPAYAGSRDQMSAMLLGRFQWTGLPGAPTTQSFALHAPSADLRHGFGGMVTNDHIGVANTVSLSGMYAYRIPVGAKGKLCFGLQGNLQHYRANYSNLHVKDESDQTLTSNVVNMLIPNAGAGIYYDNERFYAGFSLPRLWKTKLATNSSDINSTLSPAALLTAGVLIDLSDQVVLKPSILAKYAFSGPMALDINASVLLKEKLWLGMSYRMQDAVVALGQFQVTNQLRIGYAYDMNTSKLRTYNGGSHEVMLSYDFKYNMMGFISPRRF